MDGLRIAFNKKAAVRFSLAIAAVAFVSVALIVASKAASANAEPFKMAERTEYGFSSNDVYLTFTDSLGRDQSLTNVTFAFADSSKTRTLDVKELLAYQSYQTNVYGIANVSKGTVAKSEQKTISSNANGTVMSKTVDVYYDSMDRTMNCDFVEGGECFKAETAVVGTETKRDYLPAAAYVREKEITDGTRITQKADVGMQIPNGGETKIKVSMSHLPFYKISVSALENKYNITACSDAGCVNLDPMWWNVSYDYRYLIKSNSTVTNSSVIAVNDTYGINGNVLWTNNASSGENVYLYCQNSGCKSGLIAVANETNEKSWLNETNGGGNAPNAVSPKGFVGWWTFNNATGIDVTGKGHTLTAIGATAVNASGVFGNSGVTNSTNAWEMTAAQAVDFGNIPQITVSAWARFGKTPSGQAQIIATKVNIWSLRRSSDGTNTLAFMMISTTSETILTGDAIPANTWQHIAAVYNSTHIVMYQNGTQTGVIAKTGILKSESTYNFGIGQTPSPYSSERWLGSIDDVRIYNISLSAKDIQDMYYNGRNNHTSLGTEELMQNCDEASARSWIEAGIRDALGSPTIYTDKQVYTRNLTNGQQLGKFDKFVADGSKRWAFNFVSTGESATNIRNMTPVFYVWEMASSSCTGTEASVHNFIDQTK